MRRDLKQSERLSLERPPLKRSGPSSTWRATCSNSQVQRLAKIINWVEEFAKIRTKTGEIQNFRCNRIQEILLQYVAWCWQVGIMVRVVTPKSRQLGSSTFWELLEYGMCELVKGYRAAIVAHHEDGASELFGKIETVKRGLKKPSVVSGRSWGESHLVNDQGGFLKWASESEIWSATIKTGDGLGKGGTLSAVHFSEVANFCDLRRDAKSAIMAIVNSMAKTPMCMEIYESTAKGKDPVFFELCEQARDPESGVALQLIFLPWFLDSGYVMSWEAYRQECISTGKTDPGETFEVTEEEQALVERLKSATVEPHEQLYRYQVELTEQQLVWRRWAIANKCGNDLDVFYQYYPSFYEECFTASASGAFDQDTIEHYRQHAKPFIARGEIAPGHPKLQFVQHNAGVVRMWAEPVPGAQYVIGADPGGTTKRSDPSCAYVVHAATLEQVASVHGHPEWDHFSDAVHDLGIFYNNALLVVENNHNPAVVNRIFRKNYPNLYCYFVDAKHEANYGKNPGFNTNARTRPELIHVLRRACRERKVVINDPEFWKEMSTFVWVAKAAAINPEMDGTYRAVGANKDDRVMALALALSQCPLDDAAPVSVESVMPSEGRAYAFYLGLLAKRGPNNVNVL